MIFTQVEQNLWCLAESSSKHYLYVSLLRSALKTHPNLFPFHEKLATNLDVREVPSLGCSQRGRNYGIKTVILYHNL